MAEGLLRFMNGDLYEAYSAGIIATYVDPRAIKVMSEIGIDISGQASKGMMISRHSIRYSGYSLR